MAYPRADDGGDDGRNVVVHKDNTLRFVVYVRDIIRIASEINNWNIVGAIDPKTFITAELGRGFTVEPPKRVTDCEVCAIV